MARLIVVPDKAAVSEAAAGRIASVAKAAVATRGAAATSLTGGGTPDLLYQLLADPDRPWRVQIDWTHVHLFWSDERAVPPDHPQSNFGPADRTLIQHVPVPETQVHRIRGELPAADAGRLYDAILRARRGQTVGALFDVMLLGIGPDAHIASLFPGSPLLAGAHEQLAAGVWIPQLTQWRITMTPAALLDSDAIIMIASGASKADAIAAAIDAPEDVARHPAQILRAAGDRVEWILDEAAAARLERGGR